MPMVPNNFSGLITFTRASGATFVGSNGLIQLAATNVPRFDYDPVTLAVKGLLIEEQRTNLLTWSEQFDNAAWAKVRSSITTNVTTSPDGTVNADKLVEDTTANNTHIVLQIPTASPSTTYTYSVFLKAAERTRASLQDGGGSSAAGYFDLSNGTVISVGSATATIANVGNNWYRCTITFTTGVAQTAVNVRIFLVDTGTNITYTGDGTSGIFIWGAQLEQGAFSTSYIPTVASQVTRSADVALVNTLSPWYNAAEGTLFADYIISNAQVAGAPSVVSISDNTNANRIQLSHVAGDRRAVVTSVGVAEFAAVGGALGAASAGIAAKLAVAYKTSNFAACANSGSIISSASGSVPVGLSRITIGADGAANFQLNGIIRRITYLPRRLSNVDLQAITA